MLKLIDSFFNKYMPFLDTEWRRESKFTIFSLNVVADGERKKIGRE